MGSSILPPPAKETEMRDKGWRLSQYKKHKRRWEKIYKNVFVTEGSERMYCIRAVTRRPCSLCRPTRVRGMRARCSARCA